MAESTSAASAPIFENDSAVEAVLADAEELSPVNSEGADEGADEGTDEGAETIGGGGKGGKSGKGASKGASKAGKQYFNVVHVIGAPMPSDNAKYAGSSPSVAAKKAARKVWDKSQQTRFTLIMRKASQQVAGRTLYKYEMTMTKLADPIAFFTVKVPGFSHTSGAAQKSDSKRVKIVRSSAHPIFGHIDDDGKVIGGDDVPSGPRPSRHPGGVM